MLWSIKSRTLTSFIHFPYLKPLHADCTSCTSLSITDICIPSIYIVYAGLKAASRTLGSLKICDNFHNSDTDKPIFTIYTNPFNSSTYEGSLYCYDIPDRTKGL